MAESNTTKYPPWLFIVGAPRSGTTLLWAMLNSHPDIAVPFESHFIPKLLRDSAFIEADPALAVDRFCGALSSNGRFKAWELTVDSVRDEIEHRFTGRDVPTMIRGTFSAWARSQGKSRWADKTPNYAVEMPAIADAFAEARFVHLIRDGRNNACSFRAYRSAQYTIEGAAVVWSRYVEGAQSAGRKLHPSRYIEVRYEDLVADPDGTLRLICDMAQVDFAPSMLDYMRNAERLLTSAKRSQAHPGVSEPPTIGLRDYRREMSEHDLMVFEGRVGPLLASLGYPLAAPRRWTRHVHRMRHLTRGILRSANSVAGPRRWSRLS